MKLNFIAAEGERLAVVAEQSAMAEEISAVRYRNGAGNFQSWLDAQDKHRNADVSLAQNRLNQLNNHVKLVQALGEVVEAGYAAAVRWTENDAR